jgi:hypothetical protein
MYSGISYSPTAYSFSEFYDMSLGLQDYEAIRERVVNHVKAACATRREPSLPPPRRACGTRNSPAPETGAGPNFLLIRKRGSSAALEHCTLEMHRKDFPANPCREIQARFARR